MRVPLHGQRNRRQINIDMLNSDFELQRAFHVLCVVCVWAWMCVRASEGSESDAPTGTQFAQCIWLIRR